MNIEIELKRLQLPAGFQPDLGGDPGYCYTACYRGFEKQVKMAYLIGRYPTWGKVLAKGGLDNQIVSTLRNSDGSYHITNTTGCGFIPRELSIPREAIVGSSRTNIWERLAIVMIIYSLFGLTGLAYAIPLLILDASMESWFVSTRSSSFDFKLKRPGWVVLMSLLCCPVVTAEPNHQQLYEFNNQAELPAELLRAVTVSELKTVKGFSFADEMFQFIPVPKHNEYCIQPALYAGLSADEWVNDEPLDDDYTLSCEHVDQFTKDIVRLRSGENVSPVGMDLYHSRVIRSLEMDLKPHELCISDEVVRVELLTSKVSERNLITYIETVCPSLPAGGSWIREARMINLKEDERSVAPDKFKLRDTTDSGRDLSRLIVHAHDTVREDLTSLAKLGKGAHDAGVSTIAVAITKAAEIQLDVIDYSERIVQKGRDTISDSTITLDGAFDALVNIPRVVIESGSAIVNTGVSYLEEDNLNQMANSLVKETTDLYNGIKTGMPSSRELGENTGDALSWTFSTTSDVFIKSAKYIDKIIENSPHEDVVAETLWSAPATAQEYSGEAWKWAINTFNKDNAVHGIASLPWLSEQIGATVAAPMKGFYETLPEIGNDHETVTNYRQAVFGRWDSKIFGDLPWFSNNQYNVMNWFSGRTENGEWFFRAIQWITVGAFVLAFACVGLKK